jgi:flagellar FliJ protein
VQFKFKLESLLSHRQYIEDVLGKEFAVLEKRLAQEKQVEKHLQEKHTQLTEELKKHLQKPKPVSENRLYVTYIAYLSEQIGRQRHRVQMVEAEKREKKIALLKAVKKKKILERLKQTHADQYQRFNLKKEQEVSDEIGIQQYNHKTG